MSNNNTTLDSLKATAKKHEAQAKLEDNIVGDGKRNVVCKSAHIRTVEQLLAYCEVDLDLWEVTSAKVNKWEVGAKDDNNDICVTPLFQVKVTLGKRKGVELARGIIKKLLKQLEGKAPKIRATKRSGKTLGVIAIADPHFGKLGWRREVGESYDLDIATEMYLNACADLLKQLKPHKPERLLFEVLGDHLHTDGIVNATTNGTPQDCDGRFQKAFTQSIEAMNRAIEMCAKEYLVDVEIIPGNHDRAKLFMAGECVRAYWRNHRAVKVSNAIGTRAFYAWGKNAIMMVHGDKEKASQLPLIMATQHPDFHRCWCRDIHLGHVHIKREKVAVTTDDEDLGVRMSHVPSLSGPDAWHHASGYISRRVAEARVYRREGGCSNVITHFPDHPSVKGQG